MASSNDRLSRFQALLAGKADLAFVPISTDLDYLAGIARDIDHPPRQGRIAVVVHADLGNHQCAIR